MIILQDTREQLPLSFDHSFITEVRRQKLDVGDYAVEYNDGHIPPVVFERKSLEDLFGTLSNGYSRFKKEIIRAKDKEIKIIIIVERCLSQVKRGCERSFRSGDAIISQLFTIEERYGIKTVFCNNREESSEYITQKFLAIGREYIKSKGKACQTNQRLTPEASQPLILEPTG